MDSGRLFRALVMFLTLLGVLWAIRGMASHKRSVPEVTAAKTVKAAYVPEIAPRDTLFTLPLVVVDNTCGAGRIIDLSGCTGKLSRSEGQSYRFSVSENQSLVITVTPTSELFDPSFALFAANGKCVTGSDFTGEGQAETAKLDHLAAGTYELIVSGYADYCGPFQLTIHEPLPIFSRAIEPKTTRGANGTAIHWAVFGESGALQYQVYRKTGTDRTLLIALRGHGGPARNAEYRYLDRAITTADSYEVVAVTGSGESRLVGTTLN